MSKKLTKNPYGQSGIDLPFILDLPPFVMRQHNIRSFAVSMMRTYP